MSGKTLSVQSSVYLIKLRHDSDICPIFLFCRPRKLDPLRSHLTLTWPFFQPISLVYRISLAISSTKKSTRLRSEQPRVEAQHRMGVSRIPNKALSILQGDCQGRQDNSTGMNLSTKSGAAFCESNLVIPGLKDMHFVYDRGIMLTGTSSNGETTGIWSSLQRYSFQFGVDVPPWSSVDVPHGQDSAGHTKHWRHPSLQRDSGHSECIFCAST
jgi:hypothetical protein